MKKVSGGLVLYKKDLNQQKLFVLVAHPGGPFFQNKDEGWWSIPKGEPDPDEKIFCAAIREFEEERDNLRQAKEEREERAGIKGLTSIQETLKCVKQNTEKVNREKGETLQEISDMVTEMTERLRKDRENLQPKVSSTIRRDISFITSTKII